MDLRKSEIRIAVPEEAPLEEKVEIAETPRDEAEAGDAEKRVKDLRVDFDPDGAGGEVVVAGGVAHGGGGAAEEEEEHAAPGDDVEHVDCYKETLSNPSSVSLRFFCAKRSRTSGVVKYPQNAFPPFRRAINHPPFLPSLSGSCGEYAVPCSSIGGGLVTRPAEKRRVDEPCRRSDSDGPVPIACPVAASTPGGGRALKMEDVRDEFRGRDSGRGELVVVGELIGARVCSAVPICRSGSGFELSDSCDNGNFNGRE